jgi:hypothetical protein
VDQGNGYQTQQWGSEVQDVTWIRGMATRLSSGVVTSDVEDMKWIRGMVTRLSSGVVRCRT